MRRSNKRTIFDYSQLAKEHFDLALEHLENNTNQSYIPKKHDIIKLGIFHGIVEDVYFNSAGEYVVKLFLVKNAFQRGASELHESGKLMGDLQPATLQELKAEIGMRKLALVESLEKFNVQKKDDQNT